jgi:hypothetical protein
MTQPTLGDSNTKYPPANNILPGAETVVVEFLEDDMTMNDKDSAVSF